MPQTEWDSLLEEFSAGFRAVLPLSSGEKDNLDKVLAKFYRKRFDFFEGKGTLKLSVLKGQAMFLGALTAGMVVAERTNPDFWGTDGVVDPNARPDARHIEWAREVFGFRICSSIQNGIRNDAVDALKRIGRVMQVDEDCGLCLP